MEEEKHQEEEENEEEEGVSRKRRKGQAERGGGSRRKRRKRTPCDRLYFPLSPFPLSLPKPPSLPLPPPHPSVLLLQGVRFVFIYLVIRGMYIHIVLCTYIFILPGEEPA